MEDFDLYEVQEGDTLQTLSLKFGVSILNLKTINNLELTNELVPCLLLKIPERDDPQIDPIPIDSQIFDSQNPIDGQLLLEGNTILFKPYDQNSLPIVIDILGLVYTKIKLHPCETLEEETTSNKKLGLLSVYYLNPPTSLLNLHCTIFTGTIVQLTHYQKKLLYRAAAIQKSKNFQPPPFHHFSRINSLKSNQFRFEPDVIIHGESRILNSENLRQIRKHFPHRFFSYEWRLVFSIAHDGTTFTSFHSKIKHITSCILSIRTNDGDRFGAFLPNAFHKEKSSYNSGECFLFTFQKNNNVNNNDNNNDDNNDNYNCTVYKWAKTTPFFITASPEQISIEGEGTAAIWIDGKFLNGFSEKCQPFNSLQLTSQAQFKIADFEIWEIGSKFN